MDAEKRRVTGKEFLEKTPIEELHRTTKISYTSLEQLKRGEFASMPRVKFFGFVRLMSSYYPEVDFSDLIEEYEAANPQKEQLPDLTGEEREEEEIGEEGRGRWLWIGGVGVVVAILYFLFQRGEESRIITAPPPPDQKPKVVKLDYNVTQFVPPPANLSANLSAKNLSNSNLSTPTSANLTAEQNRTGEGNRSGEGEEVAVKREVVIWPVKRVWVQAKNRESGKVVAGVFTPEKPLRLGEGNFSIKTGNEYFILQIGDRNYSKEFFKGGVNRIQIEGGVLKINGKVVE
jgi:cytoskeletal protein RodZ